LVCRSYLSWDNVLYVQEGKNRDTERFSLFLEHLILKRDQLTVAFDDFTKVNAREKILGWYTTG